VDSSPVLTGTGERGFLPTRAVPDVSVLFQPRRAFLFAQHSHVPWEQEELDLLNFLTRLLLLDSTAPLTLHAVRSGRVYTSLLPSSLALFYKLKPKLNPGL
jgi:hypothetical protein